MILIFYVSEKFPQAFVDVFRRVTTAVQPWYRSILTSDGSKIRRVYLGARER